MKASDYLKKRGDDPETATYVDMSGCTGVTEVEAALAVANTDGEIPVLTAITLDAYQAPGGPMERLLTAGGQTIQQILRSGAWSCHDWNNCPVHAAFGANVIDDVPGPWQAEASRFINLFDGRFLPRPDHLIGPR